MNIMTNSQKKLMKDIAIEYQRENSFLIGDLINSSLYLSTLNCIFIGEIKLKMIVEY